MKHNLKNKILFIICLNLLLTWQISCSKIQAPEKSLQEIPLDSGTWKTSCYSITSNGSVVEYFSIEYQFTSTNSSYISTFKGYSDSSCSISKYSLEAIGTYSLSNMRGTSNKDSYSSYDPLYTMYDIDTTNQGVKAVALTADQVTAWNTSNYCGINTWSLNTKAEVSGKTCNGSIVPEIGAIDYDIIKYYFTDEFLREHYETIPPGSLTFGKSQTGADGKTPGTRKSSIETRFLYKKN